MHQPIEGLAVSSDGRDQLEDDAMKTTAIHHQGKGLCAKVAAGND